MTSAHRQGFRRKPIHRSKERKISPLLYLRHKSSFVVAALSLVAFVAGNMIGSHGVYAFWKSVWGKYDDSLIVYDGTVSPLALVPDYAKWAQVGGGGEEHTFRQVPKDFLVALPQYDVSELKQEMGKGSMYYQVGYMGSYKDSHDGTGSHPGVDIRAPKDTPVRSIANGIVTSVREDVGGFGKLVVIRHPHMPDPSNPGKTTVLYSAYAHLDAQLVIEGDIVRKGQDIGLVGKTGFATGYHLHFQIDRDTTVDGEEVPWHPYWPFTGEEARQAGLSLAGGIDAALHQERGYRYTIHPLLYVQANHMPVSENIAQAAASSRSTSQSSVPPLARLISMREARLQQRVARLVTKPVAQSVIISQPVAVASTETVAHAAAPLSPVTGDIATVDIHHDGAFLGRGWETIRITLLDKDGNVAGSDTLNQDLYLRTAFGDAEFRPEILSPLDFRNGTVEVKMLPRGRRTVVIAVQPLNVLSGPMKYEGK